jgi:hypothetical protein
MDSFARIQENINEKRDILYGFHDNFYDDSMKHFAKNMPSDKRAKSNEALDYATKLKNDRRKKMLLSATQRPDLAYNIFQKEHDFPCHYICSYHNQVNNLAKFKHKEHILFLLHSPFFRMKLYKNFENLYDNDLANINLSFICKILRASAYQLYHNIHSETIAVFPTSLFSLCGMGDSKYDMDVLNQIETSISNLCMDGFVQSFAHDHISCIKKDAYLIEYEEFEKMDVKYCNELLFLKGYAAEVLRKQCDDSALLYEAYFLIIRRPKDLKQVSFIPDFSLKHGEYLYFAKQMTSSIKTRWYHVHDLQTALINESELFMNIEENKLEVVFCAFQVMISNACYNEVIENNAIIVKNFYDVMYYDRLLDMSKNKGERDGIYEDMNSFTTIMQKLKLFGSTPTNIKHQLARSIADVLDEYNKEITVFFATCII